MMKIVIVFLAFFSLCSKNCLGQLQQIPENIRIGALFDSEEDAAVEAAFLHGVNMVNDDRSVLIRSKLNAIVDNKVPATNSFQASKRFCQMLPPFGLAAVFGPTSGDTATHIQSVAETLHVPHVETRWDYSFEKGEYSINLHPHPAQLSKAFADLIQKYGWKSFVIVYENEESLVRLQEVIKLSKSYEGIKTVMKQLDPNSDDYRPMLKQIKRSGETRIVLDCSFERIESVVRQADEIGLVTDYNNYIITSMDLERLDWSPYKYIGVNVTGYRMVDSKNPQVAPYLKKWNWKIGTGDGRGVNHPLYSKNVLMYDAVRALAKSMDDLGSIEGFRVDPVNCQQARPWNGGIKVAKYLKRIDYSGLSGEIQFDEAGFRTNFQLDLVEKQRDHLVKIGIWNPEVGVNFTRTQMEIDGQIIEKLQNKTLRITTTTVR